MGANKHRKRCFLPLYARKIRTEEIDLPAYFFSTDFACAGNSVNECYKNIYHLENEHTTPRFPSEWKKKRKFLPTAPYQKAQGKPQKVRKYDKSNRFLHQKHPPPVLRCGIRSSSVASPVISIAITVADVCEVIRYVRQRTRKPA